MQLKQSMVQTFNRKGYYPTSTISQRQFHILMNTFIARSHTVFDENITQQIWKQTQQRNQQHIKSKTLTINSKTTSNKLLPTQQQQLQQSKTNKQLKCQLIISTLVDAIQILTNRILQCQQRLQQLKTKRQQLQQNQDFSKLQSIKQKIQTLTIDLKQFQKQFKLLTQPFMNDGLKIEFKKQVSIKRNQSLGRKVSDPHNMGRNQTQNLKKQQQQKAKRARQLLLSPRALEKQQKLPLRQQKQCALYILVFLIILQLSVCLIKFNFVNLLVELVGFLVLVEENHLPSMLKIAFYSCILSTLLDGGWLFMYSKTYIESYYNSELVHMLKPYHQYIWFATLLQLFIKLIYLYFLKSYNNKHEQFNQQKKQKQSQLLIDDKYIPQVKRLAEQDNNENNSIENKNKQINNQYKKGKNLTIQTNL